MEPSPCLYHFSLLLTHKILFKTLPPGVRGAILTVPALSQHVLTAAWCSHLSPHIEFLHIHLDLHVTLLEALLQDSASTESLYELHPPYLP